MGDRERILQFGWRSKDYAEMGEKEFHLMLGEIRTLTELEGVANRRKILNAPQLTRWSDWQRAAILRRQWELKHGRG